jgi:hypothetical protein
MRWNGGNDLRGNYTIKLLKRKYVRTETDITFQFPVLD